MKRQLIHGALAAALLLGFGTPALAYGQDQDRAREQAREQQQIRDQDIYGWQLMTPQEREEYRARMRAAKTLEEREQIRAEHHERMKARAKERGVTLPEEPPARGMGRGMGPGAGMGPGTGPGGGMGGGRNR